MHPLYKTMIGTVATGGVLLALSAVFAHNEHGAKWILGGIGWFGFLLCTLTLIILALAALGRGLKRKITA